MNFLFFVGDEVVQRTPTISTLYQFQQNDVNKNFFLLKT